LGAIAERWALKSVSDFTAEHTEFAEFSTEIRLRDLRVLRG